MPPRSRTPPSLANAASAELEFGKFWGATAVYPPGGSYGPRVLPDFEFVWTLEGDAVWTCDGERHAAPPHTAILSRPGMREHYRWDPKRQSRHAFVHFSIVKGLSKLPPSERWPLIRHLPDGDVFRPLFRHLLWALNHPNAERELSVQTTLRHMLFCFLSGSMGTVSTAAEPLPAVVNTALAFAVERFKKQPQALLSIAALSRAAGASPRQLHRAFHSAFDCGPMAALRLMRLDRAAFLLSDSALQIQEIAHRTGFKNGFHFSRAFKAAFGRAPKEFRERLERGLDTPSTTIARLRYSTRALFGD
jgi:AraC family transcriptional regulator